MAAVIANQFGESTGTYRAALIGLGVVLFVMTLVIGVVARAVWPGPIDTHGGDA